MVVRANWNIDARIDLERLLYAFSGYVHAGAQTIPIPPLKVVIKVGVLRFLLAGVEVNHRIMTHVWFELVDTPRVFRSECCPNLTIQSPVSPPGIKPYFWIKVWADLGNTGADAVPL